MILFFRLLILLLLCIALWNPGIPWGKEAVDVFILLDDSQSMEGKINQKIWTDVTKSINSLSTDSRISIIRYAKNPVLETKLTAIKHTSIQSLLNLPLPPANKLVDRSVSNLEAALKFTTRFIQPDKKTIFLIIHDQLQNQGDAYNILKSLFNNKILTFQLILDKTYSIDDAWIEILNTPQFAKGEQTIPITAILASNKMMKGTVTLYVNNKIQKKTRVQLYPDKKNTLHFQTNVCSIGICSIRLELEAEHDAVQQNNIRRSVITVKGQKPLLYVSHINRQSALNTSLLLSTHKVHTIKPRLFPHSSLALQNYSGIILDDISINMLPLNSWNALDQAVRYHGLGLIVLGGSNSFSAGAYRHSLLETLLPVTAEPSQPHYSTNIIFLVDKSGSMDHDSNGVSRIALARQAIIESIKSFDNKDMFGLISFNTKPHLLLPLQHYSEPAQLIKQNLNSFAMGGTLLKPSLEFAVNEFSKLNSGKRILVLITDGFMDQQDILSVEQRIVTEKIDVISLAIGNNVNTKGLSRLSSLNNGKLLRVNKIAELPVLMRKELDERLTPLNTGEIKVKQVKEIPFMKKNPIWPALSAYMLTKPKKNSTVFLMSEKGDPLFIMRYAGVGKVVALPAGLSNWASHWFEWSQGTQFIDGLLNWIKIDSQHSQLDTKIKKSSELVSIQIDTLSPDRDWNNINVGQLILSNANGLINQQPLRRIAPGRYLANLPVDKEGTYNLAIKIGNHTRVINFENEFIKEFIPSYEHNQKNSTFSIDGLLRTWPGNNVTKYIEKRQISTRTFSLILALILYLLLLINTALFKQYKFLDSKLLKKLKPGNQNEW